VGFEVHRLARGARLETATEGREVCAVILSGHVDAAFGGHEWSGV
jgi:5-deoxy-D-glucuronate isomerase